MRAKVVAAAVALGAATIVGAQYYQSYSTVPLTIESGAGASAWQPNITYQGGMVVSYGGKLYVANSPTLASLPSSGYGWDLLVQGNASAITAAAPITYSGGTISITTPIAGTYGGLGQAQPTCTLGQALVCNGTTCSCAANITAASPITYSGGTVGLSLNAASPIAYSGGTVSISATPSFTEITGTGTPAFYASGTTNLTQWFTAGSSTGGVLFEYLSSAGGALMFMDSAISGPSGNNYTIAMGLSGPVVNVPTGANVGLGISGISVFYCSATACILAGGEALQFASACDSTASPGAATCNQGAGRAAIASGALSVAISNSLVTSTTKILWTPDFLDATCLYARACVAGSSTFTCSMGPANCTSNVPFSWMIVQ